MAADRRIDPIALAFGLLAWLAAAALLAGMAWLTPVDRSGPAALLALAAAPVLAMFLLAPHWGRRWSAAAIAIIWTGFATAATALTGGGGSPLTAAFIIGPALAVRFGEGRAAAEAVVWSLVGFGLAAYAGRGGVQGDGMTAAAGFACLAFGLWVLVAPGSPAPIKVQEAPAGDHRSVSAVQAASMAHELRTPLTHILGFAEMMQAELFGPLNEKYRDYAGLIRTSGAHLLSLVNDLMDLAKIEAGRLKLEPAAFDARAVCEEVLAEAQGQATLKALRLSMSGDDAAPVLADPRALRQVLINLVGNATKFTPDGGAVRVHVVLEGADLMIRVEDTGPGFPPSAFARLAAPFERGENVADTPGTGLGLALVRSLVEVQGGSVALANGDEGGAVVTVRLPVAVAV